MRRRADQFESQAFVHIIQHCTQGSSAVVSIMAHILRTLKSEHPEITQAFFRQDINAGCYHSTYTILSVPTIEKEVGIRVAEIGFSDPQGGKGPADRMAATIKRTHNMIHKRGEQCYQCEGNGKRDSIPWGSSWDSCSDVRQSRGTRNCSRNATEGYWHK